MVNDSARLIRAAVTRPRIRLITVRALHLSSNARHHGAIPPAVRKRPCLLTGVDGPSHNAHDEEPRGVRAVHSTDETSERHGNENSPGKLREGPHRGFNGHQVPIRVGANNLPVRAQPDLLPDPTAHQRDLPVDSDRVAYSLVRIIFRPCFVPPTVLRETDRLMSDNLSCNHLLWCRNIRLAH